MSWRIIYIEESDRLTLYLDNLKIIHCDDEILIPISDIHTLILDNYKINLSVQLINAITKANIALVICSINHLPTSLVIPHSGNSLTPLMLRKQIEWTQEIKSNVQRVIVKQKIRTQRNLLEYFKKSADVINKLELFEEEVEIADKTNREGLSAKMYFRELFGTNFKRFEEDIINAGLNYGYSILRSQISKTLISKGLNTALGFFHIGRDNQFNLSDDIIEVFRVMIDCWVYKNLINEKIFTKEHRFSLIRVTTKNMKYKGNIQSTFNAIAMFIDSLIRYVESDGNENVEFPEILFDEL